MAYSLSPLLKPRFFVNATNKPLVGGKLYTYLAETTTPATTYSNDAGTPNTNPIILDANGECNLYLDDDKVYRLILKDANDVIYFDKDRVSSIGGGDYKVLTFNTIADLRLKIGSEKEPVAQTSGYYNAGDGGGNSFYWDGTSSALDNGGTVIKPTFVSGAGRWLAVNTDTVSIAQFGAVSGNSTPQQSFINAAAAYCRNTSKKLFLGVGDYRVTAECDLSDIQYIDGSQSFLVAENGAYAACKIGGSANSFKDADIYVRTKNLADLSNTSGNLGIKLLSINNSKIRIYARGFDSGVYFDGATAALRTWVGNEFTVDQLYNNGNHVFFDMAGSSYAVKNNFNGGSYYIGTNQKVAGRGTVKVRLAGSGLMSDILFMSSEISVGGGSYDADQAVMVYADLNTTWSINTIEFKDCRYEGYNTFATDPIAVKINTTTAGRLGVSVELSGSVDASTLQVSVPEGKFNRVIMKQANTRPSSVTAFPQFIQPTKTIPYQTNGRCYVPNRVLYNGAAGFNVSAEYFTGFGTNSVNRAIGDGDCVVGQGDITYGLVYSKTVGTCTHIELSQETNFTVVCFDASGNVLSGTSPYYAVGAGFRSTTRGAVGCYEFDGKWLWLHKSVAKFYIGGSRWSSNGIIPDLSFFVNFGRNIVVDNTVQKSAPNMVSHSSGIQSYFPTGMALDGTASNGYRTTFYLSTTALNAASSADMTIDVTTATGIAVNDLIGIELDTAIATGLNRYHHTIVSGIAGNTLTLTAALPANVAVGRKILINRWVAR